MGKRSDFERIGKDAYQTIDERAVKVLEPHLYNTSFYEPCVGEGLLKNQLEELGHKCLGSSDLEVDAATNCYANTNKFDYFITNPPWSRPILHKIIENLSNQNPTWLLFDADWIHTKQAIPYLNRLKVIVSVGRLRWIPDTKMQGKDNCCWYLFDKPSNHGTIFYGRE